MTVHVYVKKDCMRYQKIVFPFFLCLLMLTLSACGSKKITDNPEALSGEHAVVITQKVVGTAKSQEGRRYRLGGETPKKGFDCSGLIYWAYQQHGITVPRITTEQTKAGKKAPKNSLRPGDILVFKSREAPNGLHTGMYLGRNRFIHAPNSRSNVRIEPLKGGYWGNHFIHARRIVGPVNYVR